MPSVDKDELFEHRDKFLKKISQLRITRDDRSIIFVVGPKFSHVVSPQFFILGCDLDKFLDDCINSLDLVVENLLVTEKYADFFCHLTNSTDEKIIPIYTGLAKKFGFDPDETIKNIMNFYLSMRSNNQVCKKTLYLQIKDTAQNLCLGNYKFHVLSQASLFLEKIPDPTWEERLFILQNSEDWDYHNVARIINNNNPTPKELFEIRRHGGENILYRIDDYYLKEKNSIEYEKNYSKLKLYQGITCTDYFCSLKQPVHISLYEIAIKKCSAADVAKIFATQKCPTNNHIALALARWQGPQDGTNPTKEERIMQLYYEIDLLRAL